MPTTVADTITPTVLVSGSPLAPTDRSKLLEVHLDLRMNLAGRCTIRYGASDLDGIDHAAVPGTAIEVKLGSRSLFQGSIVAAEVERLGEPDPSLTLVAYDKAAELAFTTGTKTWQSVSVSTVLRELAQASGLRLDASGLPSNTITYLLKAGSALELLELITERTGTEWWVSGDSLVVRRCQVGGAADASVAAKDLHRFAVRASAIRPDTVVVRGWDNVQQRPIESTGTGGGTPPAANGDLVARYVGHAWAPRTLQVSSLPVESVEEAQMLADALVKRASSGAVHAEGEGVGLEALGVGSVLEVKDGGSLTGKYLVTRVEHRWGPAQAFTTRFVAGDPRPAGVGGTSQAPAIDSYSGMVVGQVTNINDPDKRGRVRVRFVGLDNAQESAWARVLIPGGGTERGSVWLPEVGDEVVVGFEAGDLRRPVILGGLFGSTHKIPVWQVADGKVTGRRTTSRLGHFIELGDGTTPETEHIMLSFKDSKTKLRLGKDEVELLTPSGVPVKITAGTSSSITFDGNGKIAIKAREIEIAGDAKVVVKAPQVEATAQSSMKVSGTSTEVAGQGMAKLTSGGVLQVQGALVKIN